MIQPYIRTFATFTMLTIIGCSGVQAEPSSLDELINPDWAKAALWDDGQAEVAEFKGHRQVYGDDRPHTAHLITVKEDFNLDHNVKADWPYDEKPIKTVLKQNQVATIQTPNYPYYYMASVFQSRENLADAQKLTITSHEWCGITTKSFDMKGDRAKQTFISYWDGQGTGVAELESYGENVFFEEELPLIVRSLQFEEGATAHFNLYPNLTMSKAREEILHKRATLTVSSAAKDLVVPASEYKKAELWKIEIQSDAIEGKMTFMVTKQAPNTLVAYDLGGGRSYELVSTKRDAYWKRN